MRTLIPTLMARKHLLPFNIMHFNERFGCLVMILIGEGFNMIVPNLSHAWENIGFLVGYSVQLWVFHVLYYAYQASEAKFHAFRRSRAHSLAWFWSHQFLFISLLVYA